MKKAVAIARYLLALILVIFGLNKFLNFLPPLNYEEGSAALAYIVGLSGVHIFPILGALYLISAALLASNKAVGLAIVVMGAIAFNFTLFHLVLDPANIAPALIVDALLIVLALGNCQKLKSLLA